jgi:DNA-binding PadR family transcriptional regulator
VPARLVGLYALRCMERDGAVYGYSLAERIAERTGGVWRPGPGAIYPALQRLTDRGLARSRVVGRRRVYSLTPKGRESLARLRAQTTGWSPRAPDLSALWADVAGVDDVGTFLLLRLRRALDAIDAALVASSSTGNGSSSLRSLRADVIAELSARVTELGRRHGRAAPTPDHRRIKGGT